MANALSGAYPGTGQPAELKLHAVYNIAARTATSVEVTAGSVHDSDGFWPSSWQAGALYIWDLGYNSHKRFNDAVAAGAVVLQRLKEGSNPVVVASYGPTGARRPVAGDDGRPMRLADACEFGWVHHQRVLDLDVEISDERRSVLARIVCVPFGGQDRYYLTTLSRDVFTPHDVAELYRLRWEVELFFRNWKGAVRLDDVRRLQHPVSLQVAIVASMLAAVLARDMSAGLEALPAREEVGRDHRPPLVAVRGQEAPGEALGRAPGNARQPGLVVAEEDDGMASPRRRRRVPLQPARDDIPQVLRPPASPGEREASRTASPGLPSATHADGGFYETRSSRHPGGLLVLARFGISAGST